MAHPTVTMKRMVLKDYAIHLDPVLAHVHVVESATKVTRAPTCKDVFQ